MNHTHGGQIVVATIVVSVLARRIISLGIFCSDARRF
jgi:hypothetical protein